MRGGVGGDQTSSSCCGPTRPGAFWEDWFAIGTPGNPSAPPRPGQLPLRAGDCRRRYGHRVRLALRRSSGSWKPARWLHSVTGSSSSTMPTTACSPRRTPQDTRAPAPRLLRPGLKLNRLAVEADADSAAPHRDAPPGSSARCCAGFTRPYASTVFSSRCAYRRAGDRAPAPVVAAPLRPASV